ncbi:MAG: hypothetical protein BGO29_07300 [Bacteroidales bacterium 36-12]|nr:MAG: hypothetical protein BGO29_07300 [Bacteroidales bacterium 36-12]
MINNGKWIVIINLKSGKKNFRIQINYLFQQLKLANIEYEYKITEFAGHAELIAKNYANKKFSNFLIVGGDGTISEVINGIFHSNIENNSRRIAIIPRGTGNDWARFWGLTRNYKKSIDIFLEGKSQKIDIGRVDYFLEEEPKKRFFINSIGFGLDAIVAHNTNYLKRFLGSHSILYLVALLWAVFKYKSKPIHLNYNDVDIQDSLFTMNIANGCYSGGGIKQNPHAVPYDGLFDTMLLKKPTFNDIITLLPLIFNGKILQHQAIESFRIKNIILKTQNGKYFETDGIISYYVAPLTVSILAEAMEMIIP